MNGLKDGTLSTLTIGRCASGISLVETRDPTILVELIRLLGIIQENPGKKNPEKELLAKKQKNIVMSALEAIGIDMV